MNNNIFILGSEWVYLKIYLNENIADKILTEYIYHIFRKAK